MLTSIPQFVPLTERPPPSFSLASLGDPFDPFLKHSGCPIQPSFDGTVDHRILAYRIRATNSILLKDVGRSIYRSFDGTKYLLLE